MRKHLIRSTMKSMLQWPPFGIPATCICHALGARGVSLRLGKLCKYRPRQVRVDLGRKAGVNRSFVMRSEDGSDQVIRAAWFSGWRSFESPMPHVFQLIAERGCLALDIGANTGFYTLLMAAASNKTMVHAFEPFPTARRSLIDNITKNGFEGRVAIIDGAISDECGFKTLHVPEAIGADIETSASLNATFRTRHADEFEVETWSLDAYVNQHLKGKRVELMKIDVEGHEEAVVRGGLTTFQEHRPFFSLEVLADSLASSISDVLSGLNYRFLRMYPDVLTETTTFEPDPISKNQLCCPSERLTELRSILEPAGYRLVLKS